MSSDLGIGFFLVFLLCSLFYTHTSSITLFKQFYRIFPLMLMCYALPAIFSSLNIIDASHSQLSEMAKTHLMPGCLFLLILGFLVSTLVAGAQSPAFRMPPSRNRICQIAAWGF